MIATSITLSIIALALSVWIGRKNPARSSGLTAGMVVLLMLSPMLLLLPKVSVVVPWLEQAPQTTASASTGAGMSESSVGFLHIAIWLWAIGVMALTARLLAHWLTTKKWCKDAEIVSSSRMLISLENCAEILELNKLPEVRVCRQINSPIVTGLLQPTILLPQSSYQWSDETLNMVLLHELGHVKRKDLWANMSSQVACAFHWFNPMVWMLRKRLQNECEYACDEHVISRGANAKHYIYALCDVAEQCAGEQAPVAALAMANKASLKNRVENLLNKKRRSNPLLVLTILGVTATATFAYNLIQPERKPVLEEKDMNSKANAGEAEKPAADYSPQEVEKRLSANPFPAE